MNRILSLVAAIAMLPLLNGCALSPAQTSATTTALTNLANTATADMTTAIAVASAATPPDTDGVACAKAGITVVQAMQKVLAATPSGGQAGVITAAEVASLYQPGSAQYNWVVTTVETGCIAKLHDINQAAASATGVFATLLAVIPK